MSGKWNQQASVRWIIQEKRGFGGSRYDKYDNKLCVIVSGGKKPSAVYFSKLALEKLGNPQKVVVLFDANSSQIGFAKADDDEPNAYSFSYASSNKAKKKRPFISLSSIIKEKRLKSGVYDAGLYQDNESIVLVIDPTIPPST